MRSQTACAKLGYCMVLAKMTTETTTETTTSLGYSERLFLDQPT